MTEWETDYRGKRRNRKPIYEAVAPQVKDSGIAWTRWKQ